MKNILIYKSEANLHVAHFVDSLNDEAVQLQAEKMLPAGTRYRVGTTDELPADRTFRDAWDIDAADLDHVSGLNVITRAIESLITQIEQGHTDMDNVETHDTTEQQALVDQLTRDVTQADEIWNKNKSAAFEAKKTWEQHLSQAEQAEQVVEQAGDDATDEQKQQATTLRAKADQLFKTQDDLFAHKREAADAKLLLDDATTELERVKQSNDASQQRKQQIQQAIDTLQQALDDKQQQLEQFKQQHNITQS